MTAPEILMLRPLLPDHVAEIETLGPVHRWWEVTDKPGFLAARGPAIRALATDGHVGAPADLLAGLPNLGMIACYGVGYDNVPVTAVRARGIRVTNTPDVLNDAVAELTLGLMLALCRQIPAADAFVRRGDWTRGSYPLTGELTGTRAGILGLGRIGREIARRLAVMRMEVVYHGRQAQPDAGLRYFPDLTEMAAAVDWLVVIMPASPATRGIVSREVLEALGPKGVLVNVARGTLVDEAALVDLLTSGGLGGAALDVFADEPHPLPGLLGLPNVVLSPHQGSATERTRTAMGQLVVDNLRAWAEGRALLTEVMG